MTSSHRARARLRTTPLALGTGLVASVVLALSLSGTMSAFTASITNDKNSATTGTLVMEERRGAATDGAATCTSSGGTGSDANAATCSSINKFGGDRMVPGTTVTTTVAIKNAGTVPASTFRLTGGTCTPTTSAGAAPSATAADLCSKLQLVLTSKDGATVWSKSLDELSKTSGGIALPSVAAGETVPFTFALKLADGATNAYQGLTASMPLTWTFTAGS